MATDQLVRGLRRLCRKELSRVYARQSLSDGAADTEGGEWGEALDEGKKMPQAKLPGAFQMVEDDGWASAPQAWSAA